MTICVTGAFQTYLAIVLMQCFAQHTLNDMMESICVFMPFVSG